MMANRFRLAAAALVLLAGHAQAAAQDLRSRLPEDEIIYFLLPDRFENGDPANDRGGLAGGRLATGFDPAHKGFYHGGDLKGLLGRLDYIQGLGRDGDLVRARSSRTSRCRAGPARRARAIMAIG